MYHNRELNHRINRLHERALRLVYNNSTASFEELLQLDGSFTIHQRNIQKLATELYKVKHNLSPQFMNVIFPSSDNPYDLRINNDFKQNCIRTTYYGSETISFQGPNIWSSIPDHIKNSSTLNEFRAKIRDWVPEGCTCRICKVYIVSLGFIS